MESYEKWIIKRIPNGLYTVYRIFPKTSYTYFLTEDLNLYDSENHPWYLEYNNDSDAISKHRLQSIQWPTWLSAGEEITIIVLPSGNYYIDE